LTLTLRHTLCLHQQVWIHATVRCKATGSPFTLPAQIPPCFVANGAWHTIPITVVLCITKTVSMETNTASTRTQALLSLFDYHTGFFAKVLDGLSEADMHNRLNTQANHPAWLAGALVNQRFMMATDTNTGIKQTGEELFKNNKGIQEGVTYPTIAAYVKDWEQITPLARKALVTVDDKKLDSDFDMGGMTMPFYDMIVFTIYREASIIGQLALWRRLLGHPALKYG
jgi:hypothetical protein